VEDLAPRIKELKAQMDGLEQKRIDLMESIREAKVDLFEASVVRAYVDDLKALLSKGSIVEQKSFLRSFVKRIDVDLTQVVITYTLPLKTQKVEPLEREVLPFAYDGSPGRIRTSDQVVNSHSLCRLSYRGTKIARRLWH
jgi:site-specific DNA recombinase